MKRAGVKNRCVHSNQMFVRIYWYRAVVVRMLTWLFKVLFNNFCILSHFFCYRDPISHSFFFFYQFSDLHCMVQYRLVSSLFTNDNSGYKTLKHFQIPNSFDCIFPHFKAINIIRSTIVNNEVGKFFANFSFFGGGFCCKRLKIHALAFEFFLDFIYTL